MDYIATEDVSAIIRMLGEISGMTSPLEERRRALMRKLSIFVDADIWIWVHSRRNEKGDVSAFSFIDGGYLNDQERGRLIAAANNPTHIQVHARMIEMHTHRTVITADAKSEASDKEWKEIEELYAMSELSSSVLSSYPLGQGVISGIGLHRRANKPAFSDRERFLAHLVISQIDWLHRVEQLPQANNDRLFELTPRQRQALILLLQGQSAKQIAATMEISLNTTQDHISEIYRRYGVSGRNELLSLFVAGGKRN